MSQSSVPKVNQFNVRVGVRLGRAHASDRVRVRVRVSVRVCVDWR